MSRIVAEFTAAAVLAIAVPTGAVVGSGYKSPDRDGHLKADQQHAVVGRHEARGVGTIVLKGCGNEINLNLGQQAKGLAVSFLGNEVCVTDTYLTTSEAYNAHVNDDTIQPNELPPVN